jgi:hypothetical protein
MCAGHTVEAVCVGRRPGFSAGSWPPYPRSDAPSGHPDDAYPLAYACFLLPTALRTSARIPGNRRSVTVTLYVRS